MTAGLKIMIDDKIRNGKILKPSEIIYRCKCGSPIMQITVYKNGENFGAMYCKNDCGGYKKKDLKILQKYIDKGYTQA